MVIKSTDSLHDSCSSDDGLRWQQRDFTNSGGALTGSNSGLALTGSTLICRQWSRRRADNRKQPGDVEL